MPDEPNEFEKNFEEFSFNEDMLFTRDMILSEASDLQEVYRYIYDFHRQHPSDELATVLECVRLAKLGLERGYDIIDNKLFDKSEAQDYTWIPNKD